MGTESLDCRAVEEGDLIEAYLRETLAPEEIEAFERHYLGCDRCAAELALTLEVRATLRSERAAKPIEGRSTERSAAVRASWAWRALTAAASLGFVALGLSVVLPRARVEPAPAGASATPTPVWRGAGVPLEVAASRAPDGAVVLSWAAVPAARTYVVRILAADATTLLEQETPATRLVLEPARLAAAKAPLRVRIKAMSPLGYAVAQSEPVAVPER